MNPHTYSRVRQARLEKQQSRIFSSIRSFAGSLAGAEISAVMAIAIIVFAATSVGALTLVAQTELSGSGAAFATQSARVNPGKVLGVAAYGYNQPVCGYNTANCLNYQLIGFSGSGWQIRIDYNLRPGIVGAIRVNTWPFMDNISGSGSGYTGNDLLPNNTYTFVLYQKYGSRLGRQLTGISITAPDRQPQPVCPPQAQAPAGCYYDNSNQCGGNLVCTPSYGYNIPSPITQPSVYGTNPESSNVRYVTAGQKQAPIYSFRVFAGPNQSLFLTGFDLMVKTFPDGNSVDGKLTNISVASLDGPAFATNAASVLSGTHAQATFNGGNGPFIPVGGSQAFGVYADFDGNLPTEQLGVTLSQIMNVGNVSINGAGFINGVIQVTGLPPLPRVPVSITGPSSNFSQATVGQFYSARFTVAPYAEYAMTESGSLPPGLSLNQDPIPACMVGTPCPVVYHSSYTLSGIPTQAGSYTFQLKATDSTGYFGINTFTITVNGTPVSNGARVGTLVYKSDKTVYLVGNNVLYPIPSLAVFNSWAWKFSDVQQANSIESSLPVSGTWVPSRDPSCNTPIDQINGACATIPQPLIKMIYPNGGENFVVGQTYNITWSVPSNWSNVWLTLTKVNVNGQNYSGCLSAVDGHYNSCGKEVNWNSGVDSQLRLLVPNTGSYYWTVPQGFAAGNDYYFRIEAPAAGQTAAAAVPTYYADVSDQPFAVVSATNSSLAKLNIVPYGVGTGASVGFAGAQIGNFRLRADNASVAVKSLTLTFTGSALWPLSDLANVKVFINGKQAGSTISIAPPSISTLTFEFSNNTIILPPGQVAQVLVNADIIDGANTSMTISLASLSSIQAVDVTYNQVITPVLDTTGGPSRTFPLMIGELNISPTGGITARVGAIINKNGTVYLVGQNGLYGFPDIVTFNSWGYSFSNVVTANTAEQALNQIGVVPVKQPGCNNPLDQINGACGTTGILGSIGIGLNGALASPVVATPGAVSQRLASFSATVGNVSGAAISNIVVNAAASGISGYFQNLKILVNGSQFGQTQAVLANGGTYYFSGSQTFPAGATVIIDLYADVPVAAPSGFNQPVFFLNTLTGYYTVNNSPLNSQPSPAMAGQAVSIASNYAPLSVTFNSPASPASQNVIGGTTNQPIAVYSLIAPPSYSAIVQEMDFIVLGSSASPITAVSVNGIKAAVVNNSVNMTGLNISVPAGYSGVNVPVQVDYAAVGPNGVPANTSFVLNLGSVKYIINGTTQSVTANVPSNQMTLAGSASSPTISDSLDPSSPPAGSVSRGQTGVTFTLVRFTSTGGDSSLNNIIVAQNSAESQVSNIKVYDASSGILLGSLPSLPSSLNDSNQKSSPINFNTNWVVPSGTSKSLKIAADVPVNATGNMRLGIIGMGSNNPGQQYNLAASVFGNYLAAPSM